MNDLIESAFAVRLKATPVAELVTNAGTLVGREFIWNTGEPEILWFGQALPITDLNRIPHANVLTTENGGLFCPVDRSLGKHKKYVVQAKTITIHSATVEASSMKEACKAYLAGKADAFDTLDLETNFVSVIAEQ